MPYGIANQLGQPDESVAGRILDAAMEGGITCLDTASVYGSSEQILGTYFEQQARSAHIITKIHLTVDHETTITHVEEQIEASVQRSMERLQTSCIPAVLLHRPNVLGMFGDKVTELLRKQVKRGNIGTVGASLLSYEAQEFAANWQQLQDDFYEIIQLPINVMDRRMFANGAFDRLRNANKKLFARSIYLQGLFFLQPTELKGNLQVADRWLTLLRTCADQEGMTVPELAFSYIHHMPGIASIVFGAETPKQVEDNIALLATPAISERTLQVLETAFSEVPELVISPSMWAV
ncbi:aryl-alcohol dehydrogenase-like predicted oxidoreductase [Paenibacillus qinlingensis]|uniref:Aryl-alcohol dehydrogenase-like predicted oxidoreductase n=2 Tax=Paenibacillus qinlingensis TaxID=1837343 RepID=A0ABU1NSM3_9BACL|nr:aryl-alcohol dehydrogenase-like predicted oxidoreductase [Paenibacillus qinlingensis]